MNLTDTQRETLVRAYYEPLGWDLDDLDDDEFRECLAAFEPVVAAVEAIVAPYAEALARVEALAANREELIDLVVMWLYNGPEGHVGPPPPRECLADLDCDARNALDAVFARVRAALAPATPDTP